MSKTRVSQIMQYSNFRSDHRTVFFTSWTFLHMLTINPIFIRPMTATNISPAITNSKRHRINSIPVIIQLSCLKPITESIIHLFIAAGMAHFDSSFASIRADDQMFYSSLNYARTSFLSLSRGDSAVENISISVYTHDCLAD